MPGCGILHGRTLMLEMDSSVWQEGFQAAQEGKAPCPYPARSQEAWSWHWFCGGDSAFGSKSRPRGKVPGDKTQELNFNIAKTKGRLGFLDNTGWQDKLSVAA